MAYTGFAKDVNLQQTLYDWVWFLGKSSDDGGRSAQGAIAIAVVALAVALLALAIPMLGLGYYQQQQSSVMIPSSFPIVNQQPAPRIITMEWEATLPSLQDRWFPQYIVVNQGDSLVLTLEVNDTDGAHTFTVIAPTGPGGASQLTQINMSMPGQWMYHPPAESGPQFGIEVTGAPVGCSIMGQSVNCNASTNLAYGACNMNGCTIAGGCSINGGPLGPCTGSWMLNKNQTEIAEIQTQVTIGPLTMPGVYRYFCTYHQYIGMVGYIVVLPNRGYAPTGSTTGATANQLFSVNRQWLKELAKKTE